MHLIRPQKRYASVQEMVQDVFGPSVQMTGSVGVPGGDINNAYQFSLSDGNRIFVKTNSVRNANFFWTEARGLDALRTAKKIGVPNLLGVGVDVQKGYSFLALEYVESSVRVPNYWETFGHQLAELHRWECSSYVNQKKDKARYGFLEDNYIGANPQKNTPQETWVGFYRDCRLLPQITMAEGYLEPSVRKKADRLLEHLDRYLREPDIPSLLHGDLWSGNMLCGPDGTAWILDPAVYVGDFETDLAMTQLFGSLPEKFYGAYHEVNPIDVKGYRERRKLYDLYHLLNHLNLFGEVYLGSVVEILNWYVG